MPTAPLTYRVGQRLRGFTLVELIISMGLLSIILYTLAFTFAQSQKAFSRVTTAVDAHQEARAILDLIAEELTAAQTVAYWDVGASALTQGIFQASDSTVLEGAPRETGTTVSVHVQDVNFTTTAFQPGNNPAGQAAAEPQLVEVCYRHAHPLPPAPIAQEKDIRLAHPDERILRKSTHWVDWANWDGDAADDTRFGGAEGAGFSVVFFGLRFFDAGIDPPAWTSDGNWSRSYLPAAVEITLVVRPAKAKRDYAFVRIVEIPAARQQ